MTDTTTYHSTLPRPLVSESDTDPMNSSFNPWGIPNLYVPAD